MTSASLIFDEAASTADMIFGVHELIAYISRFMVLEPSDVINTGTPAGVPLGRSDQAYLAKGRQRQTIGAA